MLIKYHFVYNCNLLSINKINKKKMIINKWNTKSDSGCAAARIISTKIYHNFLMINIPKININYKSNNFVILHYIYTYQF